MNDLVKRLRDRPQWEYAYDLTDEAADRIGALETEVAKQRDSICQDRFTIIAMGKEADDLQSRLAAMEENAEALAAFITGTYAGDPKTAERRRMVLAAHEKLMEGK